MFELLSPKELEAGKVTQVTKGFMIQVIAPHDERECAPIQSFIIPNSNWAESIVRGFIHSGYTTTVTEVDIKQSIYDRDYQKYLEERRLMELMEPVPDPRFANVGVDPVSMGNCR